LTALRIYKLRNCTVVTGAISGSIFIEECEDCIFHLASRQLRIHSSKNCEYYLFLKSNPIIEESHGQRFAPYTFDYEERKEQFEKANFELSKNNWNHVEDFNWLKAQQSPHWCIIPENDRKRSPN